MIRGAGILGATLAAIAVTLPSAGANSSLWTLGLLLMPIAVIFLVAAALTRWVISMSDAGRSDDEITRKSFTVFGIVWLLIGTLMLATAAFDGPELFPVWAGGLFVALGVVGLINAARPFRRR